MHMPSLKELLKSIHSIRVIALGDKRKAKVKDLQPSRFMTNKCPILSNLTTWIGLHAKKAWQKDQGLCQALPQRSLMPNSAILDSFLFIISSCNSSVILLPLHKKCKNPDSSHFSPILWATATWLIAEPDDTASASALPHDENSLFSHRSALKHESDHSTPLMKTF